MIQRTAIRAIPLHRAKHEVLLIEATVPDTNVVLWMTPGGGIDPGEDDEQCMARELFEETGYRHRGPAQYVWRRQHQFLFQGDWYDQTERYYLIDVPRFEPTTRHNPAVHETDNFVSFRWWPLAELRESADIFVPNGIAHHLCDLIEQSVETFPVDVSD